MQNPPTILIIEDNQASLDVMQARLVAQGYEVITAKDGAQGLERARERLPDLILSDIMMPKIDGLEVCRRIRSDPSLPFIPIILVTAKGDTADVVAGLEAGGDEYLTKPVNHTSLVARVKSMLRIKDLHDRMAEQADQLRLQLETASKVQTLFWAKEHQERSDLNIWSCSEPASYVGGDLYDILSMSDDSTLVYVSDIAGKGVPAALLMAALSTMIRAELPFYDDMARLIQTVNGSMVQLSSEEGYFATLICGRYWPGSGRLQLLRAGHPFPLWIRQGRILDIPWLEGIPLGIEEDITYETCDIFLAPGDSCLFYSDGVIEAENEQGEMFGGEHLVRCIENITQGPWGPRVADLVRSWRGSRPVSDDTTLLEIRQGQ